MCMGNTSNLTRHPCCKVIKQSVILKAVSALDKTEAVEKCTNWITEDCRPFSAVSGSGFRKLVNFFIKIGATYGEHVDVEDMLPDSTTISRRVQKIANEKKDEIKNEITKVVSSGGASATIDMWTDNYVKRNFLGVTFHYQNEFKFFDIVLVMKSMDFERSTSENILKKLRSVFHEFGVENMDQVKFITDRGSNIVKALDYHTRLNCSSHLFSNVLDKSFAATTDLDNVLESCKKLVKYFKKASLQHLLPRSLKSQCPTRWNSNYRMLKSILDNWAEVNTVLARNDESLRTLNIDRNIVRALVELSENFEIIFKKLQLCSSPSICYVIPSITKVKNLCQPLISEIAAISSLKNNILKHIDETWSDNLSMWHKLAFFLYPPALKCNRMN